MRDLGRSAVAFSGGVDSAVLLAVCAEELGEDVIAVTAVSPSLARTELEGARDLARDLGVELVEIETREMDVAEYVRNQPDRCFHCKSTLFVAMERVARERGIETLLYGSNLSDAGDHRPGEQAATERGVRAPLREAELTKDDVREIGRRLGLSVWDKPAAPCLSSRIAYGIPVTEEALRRIEEAEGFLREVLEAPVLRVRHHGDVARIEIPRSIFSRAMAERDRIVSRLNELGYRYVTLDLAGFRSGSLNEVLLRGTE